MPQTPWPEASLSQQRALAWVPKLTSLLSILGSCYIVFDILRIHVKNRNTYHRILLGMNVMDLLSLSAWFFTTWPIPQSSTIYEARGNQATCNAQGYFSQWSISVVLYNACLALYFMVVIRFGWTEHKISQYKLEWYIHGVCMGVGFLTSSLALGMELYNPVGWQCWIGAWPIGCDTDEYHMELELINNNDTTNTTNNTSMGCQRGGNANLYLWFLFYLPLWACIIFASGALYQVYAAFHRQHRQGDRWRLRYAISRGWGGLHNNTQTQPNNTTPQQNATLQHATPNEPKKSPMDDSSQKQPTSNNNPMTDDSNTSNPQSRQFPMVHSTLGFARRSLNQISQQSRRRLRNKETSTRPPHTKSTRRKKPNAKSQLVTSQALLYVFSFYVAWFFPSVLRIQETLSSSNGVGLYHWVFLSACFQPLQGLMNFVIYLRPKYIQIRLIKQRIAALAERQQRQQQQQQLEQRLKNTVVTTLTDHSHNSQNNNNNVQDHSNSSDQSPVYGRLTNRPLIDSSRSFDPLRTSTASSDDDMSMELTTMMMMMEEEIMAGGGLDNTNDDDEAENSMSDEEEDTLSGSRSTHQTKQKKEDWNTESINQLHASFAGNLSASLTHFKSTISSGSATVKGSRASSRDYASNNSKSSLNTDNIALFNESLNMEQLEDLMEEEEEEEDEDKEEEEDEDETDYHDDGDNDDLSEDALGNGFVAHGSSSDEEDDDDEEMDPALESLFDAMTLNSGDTPGSLWKKQSASRGQQERRPTLKRSNSSEYNFASMRDMSEELKVNPKAFERFNASMNINGEGHVLGRFRSRANKNKQELQQHKRPRDRRLRTHQSYRMPPNRAMAADENPMSQSVPLTIDSSDHQKQHVPLTISDPFGGPDTNRSQQRRHTTTSDALSNSLGDLSYDEGSVGAGENNDAPGSPNSGRLGPSKRVSFIKQSGDTDNGNSNTNATRSPTSDQDQTVVIHHKPSNELEEEVKPLEENPPAERRIARRNRRPIPRSGTDPERLGRMKTPMFRRNNTAPNPQPARNPRASDNSTSDGTVAEPYSRRPVRRRMSDRLNPFRRSGTDPLLPAIEPIASRLNRTTTSDDVLHSGGRSNRRASNSVGFDKRKQMMTEQSKEKGASKWGTSFLSFAENVKDALKADDLSEWAIIMNELEKEISSGPPEGNHASKPAISRNRRASKTEEAKQEMSAASIGSPMGKQEIAGTGSPEGSPQRGMRRGQNSAVVPPRRVSRTARMRKDSD